MERENIIITIDGPAGVGKSSAARLLAAALGLPYLDTGAMYRVIGLRLGPKAADMSDELLRAEADKLNFCLERADNGKFNLLCNKAPVGEEIRTERAGRLASLVGTLPVVRIAMQRMQRQIAESQSLVAEGRDMGSKVFPGAAYKFFFDARPEIRANRRLKQLQETGETADFETILADITARDIQDRSRKIDPLQPAADAIIIDTSDNNLDQVVQTMLAVVNEQKPKPSADSPHFSHLDESGNLRMVNVGGKSYSERVAKAHAKVEMSAATLQLLRDNALPKGDVLAAAKVAGILAAKRTGELIPLCHPLNLTFVDVNFTIQDSPPAVVIITEAHASGQTGVEMEAIIAAQIAAATIYDMAKAVQKDMIIAETRLIYKAGGKSGVFSIG